MQENAPLGVELNRAGQNSGFGQKLLSNPVSDARGGFGIRPVFFYGATSPDQTFVVGQVDGSHRPKAEDAGDLVAIFQDAVFAQQPMQ